MRFQVGDPVYIISWHMVFVIAETGPPYTLNMPEFQRGWTDAELQSCAMSFAGPVKNKKWRRNGYGGR
jgi:hypothetical protein